MKRRVENHQGRSTEEKSYRINDGWNCFL